MTTVYILFSPSSKRYYAGFASEIGARLKKHNTAQNKSTSFASDGQVVWTAHVPDTAQARALEIKIKARGIARYIRDLSG